MSEDTTFDNGQSLKEVEEMVEDGEGKGKKGRRMDWYMDWYI